MSREIGSLLLADPISNLRIISRQLKTPDFEENRDELCSLKEYIHCNVRSKRKNLMQLYSCTISERESHENQHMPEIDSRLWKDRTGRKQKFLDCYRTP
jgi:hypothetical protein